MVESRRVAGSTAYVSVRNVPGGNRSNSNKLRMSKVNQVSKDFVVEMGQMARMARTALTEVEEAEEAMEVQEVFRALCSYQELTSNLS